MNPHYRIINKANKGKLLKTRPEKRDEMVSCHDKWAIKIMQGFLKSKE